MTTGICRPFNPGEIDEETLVAATARLGFNNEIDAFHVVHDGEVGVRFFADEWTRSSATVNWVRVTALRIR